MENAENNNEIFISYRRADVEFTKQIYEGLKQAELTIWVDWDDIPPGVEGFTNEIQRGIEGAVAFICILSPNYLKSEYCVMELKEAIRLKKRIVPIVLEKFEPMPAPEGIGHINWVYFTPHAGQQNTFEESLPKVIQAIKADYEYAREHAKLLQRAIDWQKNDHGRGYLLKEAELEKAERWQASIVKDPAPTELQREFILASRKDATRRQRNTLAGVTIALIVSVVLGFLALYQRQVAKTNEAEAINQRQIAKANEAEAIKQKEEAVRQSTISQAGELSSLGLSEQDDHFDLALLLGVQGLETFNNSRTQSTMFTLASAHPKLERFLWGHKAMVNNVAYSRDGSLLASASDDNSIILWNLNSPDTPSQIATLSAHKAGVVSIAFSPDGKTLASGSKDRSVILWDISDPGSPTILTTLMGHSNVVTSVAFSPNGTVLASSSWDGSIILWDIQNPQNPEKINTLAGNLNAITSVAFNPTGDRLISGSWEGWDYTIVVWDISDPASAQAIDGQWGNAGGVTSLAFSPDRQLFASGGWDHSILLWDIDNLESPIATLSGHTGAITSLTFSRDGNRLASGSEDKSIIVWDVSDPSTSKPIIMLTGHSNVVTSVAFDPNGKQLASGSWDASIILWNVDDSNNITPLQLASITDQNIEVGRIAFSQDGKRVALGGRDRIEDRSVILLWDASNPKLMPQPAQMLGEGVTVSSLAFSPDGNQLISGGWNTTTILWDISDIKNPSPLATLTGQDDIGALAFSPDGKKIAEATGGGDNKHAIILWDISDPRNPTQFATLPKQHTAAITSLAFSPDNKQLATSSRDNSIILWDISDPRSPSALATMTGSGFAIQSIAFSPHDHWLAAGNNDGSINLWDTSSPGSPSLITTLSGHHATVYSVAFNADGKLLASGSADRSLLLWDLSDISHPFIIAPLTEHNTEIKTVSFDGNGMRLASVGTDSTIKLWDTDIESWKKIACLRAGRNFSKAEWEQYFTGVNYQEVCSGLPEPDEKVSSPSIDMRAQTGFSINDVELNDAGNTITVAPGTPIHITYNLQVYSDPCPGCITQLVTGFGQPGTTGNEMKCAYDGLPGPFPGNAGAEDITITAPTTPGTYPIIVEHQWEYTCDDARNKYGSGDFAMSHQLVGQVIVTSSP